MKYKILFVILVMALCVLSCDKGGAEAEHSIFRHNVLKGISQKLGYYQKNKVFTVTETFIGPDDNPRQFPYSWYTAKNSTISVAFWPDSHGGDGTSDYHLKFFEIREKTKKYFLGRFIGMTAAQFFEEYPVPFDYEERAIGENHIVYTSDDGKKLVNFWLEDNVIVKAGFGYSL